MRSSVYVFVLLAAAALCGAQDAQDAQDAVTAVDVLQTVYDDCLQAGSFDCVRPRVLSFLSSALKQNTVRITRDLSIVPSKVQVQDSNGLDAEQELGLGLDAGLLSPLPADPAGRRAALRYLLLERVERFLQGHELRAQLPQELPLPAVLRTALPSELRVPLGTEEEGEGQGQGEARHRRRKSFIRKVVLPFILGLKFKATALIPLALALIALKTWKALTLGLLSLVLSGAMVIFRFTKPKVVNYDVYHYPQHYEHHGYDQPHYDHYDHHSYARSDDADSLAYRAHHQ